MKKLGLNYVDLYLIHWPASIDKSTNKPYTDFDYVDTYRGLQKVYKNSKKIRAIGVSNFTKKKLERLLSSEGVDVVPAVNQIEAHPLLTQPELYDYLKEKVSFWKLIHHWVLQTLHYSRTKPSLKSLKRMVLNQLKFWYLGQFKERLWFCLNPSPNQELFLAKTFTLPSEDFETLNKLSEKDGVVRTCNPAFNNFDD